MGSPASLWVLSVIAAALAVVLVLDSDAPRVHRGSSRRVVPEYRLDDVRELRIERVGRPAAVIAARDGVWRMTAPVAAALDRVAVDDLLGSLEVLSYRRRTDRCDECAHSERHLTLTLTSGRRVTVQLGAAVPALDMAWVKRGDSAAGFLVDGVAARALGVDPDDLRERRIFATPLDHVTGVEIHQSARSLLLSGQPLAVHLDSGGAVRMDREQAAALIAALHRIRVRRFVDDDLGDTNDHDNTALSVRVLGGAAPEQVLLVGACPSGAGRLVATSNSTSRACIDDDALVPVTDLLGRPRATLFDRHLLEAPLTAITRVTVEAGAGGGFTVAAAGGGWSVDGAPGETVAVNEWLSALDGALDEQQPHRTPGPLALRVRLGYRDGHTTVVEIYAGSPLLARRGNEPIIWPLRRGTSLTTALALRSRLVISVDAFALRRVSVSEGDLVRGQLLDEWRVEGTRRADVAAIAGLRAVLADLRAERLVADGSEPHHHLDPPRRQLRLEFDPPPAGEATGPLIVDIGAATPSGGCYARTDREPLVFEVDREVCAALTRPLAAQK